MKRFFLLFSFALSLFGSDYDCIFIGSSPVMLFEALYQHGLGNRVLIIDDGEELGGVWKSITMCGIEHVDMGCHEIGSSDTMKEFLEVYAGCKIVHPQNSMGFYFSRGCYELIHNLEKRIGKTDIQILRSAVAERAVLDEPHKWIVLEAGGQKFSTQKVFMAGYSYINIGDNTPPRPIIKAKYYHLYLLVADPTPPRFGYQGGGVSNCSRMVNLTNFAGLENSGQQLIVFQTHSEHSDPMQMVEELRTRNLLDPSAYLLKSEPYVYEQWPSGSNSTGLYQSYFETLSTYDFRSMMHSFAKWKQVLRPYAVEVLD